MHFATTYTDIAFRKWSISVSQPHSTRLKIRDLVATMQREEDYQSSDKNKGFRKWAFYPLGNRYFRSYTTVQNADLDGCPMLIPLLFEECSPMNEFDASKIGINTKLTLQCL